MIRHSFRRKENDNLAATRETGQDTLKGLRLRLSLMLKIKFVLKWMDVGRVLSVIFHILLS